MLSVCGEVEGDEKNEIRGENTHTSKGCKLLAGAIACVGHPVEVGAGEVSVGGEVDEDEVDNELDDLQHRDVFLPPDADAASRLKVVPVHDDVDHQVESDGHPRDGGVANELGIAEKSGGTMVVGVEEGELLLLEDEKDGVD